MSGGQNNQPPSPAAIAQLLSLPCVLGLTGEAVAGPYVYPPQDEPIMVWTTCTWDDGHTERCKSLVRCWNRRTPAAVLVWAQSSRGQHILWVPADSVERALPTR